MKEKKITLTDDQITAIVLNDRMDLMKAIAECGEDPLAVINLLCRWSECTNAAILKLKYMDVDKAIDKALTKG